MAAARAPWSARRALAASALGLVGATAIVGLTAVATAALVARTVITPPRRRIEDTRVIRCDGETITLSRSADATVPGRYSFWFDGGRGHARLGDIVDHDESSVTRRVLAVDFGDLTTARRGRFAGWFYLGPRELGVPYRNVEIASPVGPAPAWLIPAAEPTTTWAIQVHGRAVRRSEGLRAVPVFREAGYTSLLVSYRNDGDAPESDDGRYALGDTEWEDVESAMRYAVDHGARSVVLMGWSMGGATVLQAATRSSLASVVTGIVLESPVVDWVAALDYQGEEYRLPEPLRRGVLAMLGGGWARPLTGQSHPIDLARLDFVRRASELRVPILLLHSDDDGLVPASSSRALALARPDIVRYEPFSVARHTKLWNYDPDRWNAVIRSWLEELPAAGE